MRDMAPLGLRRYFADTIASQNLSIEYSGDEALLQSKAFPNDWTLGPSGAITLPLILMERLRRGAQVVITIPKSWVLFRTASLPLSALSEVHGAAFFMLERLSPYPSDKVFHTVRVVDRDRKKKIARVEIAVVPRLLVDKVLDRLLQAGLPIPSVQIEDDRNSPKLEFETNRVLTGPRYRHPSRYWKALFVASILALFVGPPIAAYRIHRSVEALRQEVLAAKVRSQETIDLERTTAHQAKSALFFPSRSQAPRPVEILANLSDSIPDSTWLFSFDMEPGWILISGFSSDVPALLRCLAAKPFGATELTGPVVRGLIEGKSRFEIRVQLNGEGSK